LERTARGARLIEGDAVLSEVLAAPGPTHSVFDLLAAIVAALAPGPGVALLGFAGGGIVAPLRAMGWDGALDAVDLDPRGERLFRELCGSWCGAVRFTRREASDWLRRGRRRFDLVIDDLSVPHRGEITKPDLSVETLPSLIRRRLAPGGVAAVNALPVPAMAWNEMLWRLAAPHRRARVVLFREFENRVLLAGPDLPPPRPLGQLLRGRLRAIESEIATAIAVRELAAP
jgi:spermidine synthase